MRQFCSIFILTVIIAYSPTDAVPLPVDGDGPSVGYIGPTCVVVGNELFIHGIFIRRLERAEVQEFDHYQTALSESKMSAAKLMRSYSEQTKNDEHQQREQLHYDRDNKQQGRTCRGCASRTVDPVDEYPTLNDDEEIADKMQPPDELFHVRSVRQQQPIHAKRIIYFPLHQPLGQPTAAAPNQQPIHHQQQKAEQESQPTEQVQRVQQVQQVQTNPASEPQQQQQQQQQQKSDFILPPSDQQRIRPEDEIIVGQVPQTLAPYRERTSSSASWSATTRNYRISTVTVAPRPMKIYENSQPVIQHPSPPSFCTASDTVEFVLDGCTVTNNKVYVNGVFRRELTDDEVMSLLQYGEAMNDYRRRLQEYTSNVMNLMKYKDDQYFRDASTRHQFPEFPQRSNMPVMPSEICRRRN